jgi:hypothetical protein
MESECSLLCSQDPAIALDTILRPFEPCPFPQFYYLKANFNIILHSVPRYSNWCTKEVSYKIYNAWLSARETEVQNES